MIANYQKARRKSHMEKEKRSVDQVEISFFFFLEKSLHTLNTNISSVNVKSL